MSSIASSSTFQYLKGLSTVVHVSSDFPIKGARGFYKFWVKYSLYLFKLSLQISFCFYDLSCLWRGLKNSGCPQMCYIKIPPQPQCINAFREANLEPDGVKSSCLRFLAVIISPSSSVKAQFSHLYIGASYSYHQAFWGLARKTLHSKVFGKSLAHSWY